MSVKPTWRAPEIPCLTDYTLQWVYLLLDTIATSSNTTIPAASRYPVFTTFTKALCRTSGTWERNSQRVDNELHSAFSPGPSSAKRMAVQFASLHAYVAT